MITLLTLINVGMTLCNIGLLAVFIKLYTEVLKIGHIKNIGKVEEPMRETYNRASGTLACPICFATGICKECYHCPNCDQGRCIHEIQAGKDGGAKL